MPAHKLVLDEVFEQPYELFAIHSSIEEYRLAYLLNKHLNLKLARSSKDIDLHAQTEEVLFAHFMYEDLQNLCTYHLVSNISRSAALSGREENSLFGEELAVKKSFLLPEFRQVDFLLKIECETDLISGKELLFRLSEIPQVTTAYAIDLQRIKSKQNLIFE